MNQANDETGQPTQEMMENAIVRRNTAEIRRLLDIGFDLTETPFRSTAVSLYGHVTQILLFSL